MVQNIFLTINMVNNITIFILHHITIDILQNIRLKCGARGFYIEQTLISAIEFISNILVPITPTTS